MADMGSQIAKAWMKTLPDSDKVHPSHLATLYENKVLWTQSGDIHTLNLMHTDPAKRKFIESIKVLIGLEESCKVARKEVNSLFPQN